MPDNFTHDVFLSHSSKDKPVVRELADRLKADGVRVWLDEWEIKPGDSIPAKVDEGLEHSRVLVLCMSTHALGSDWAQLETHTFRFRDPLNKNRRFIPLKLDDAEIKGSLKQFMYIDWRTDAGTDRDQAYAKLLDACGAKTKTVAMKDETPSIPIAAKSLQIGNKVSEIRNYAISPDWLYVLTCDDDFTLRLWDMKSGKHICELKGHTSWIRQSEWSSDSRRIISCSGDKTLRLWDVDTGRCLRVFEGHTGAVRSVTWGHDQRHVLSGGEDGDSMRLWNTQSGSCLKSFSGQGDTVWSVALSKDQQLAASGSDNGIVRLWGVKSGRCLREFQGHTGRAWDVIWGDDQRRVISGSWDNTMRLWDIKTEQCLRVLEGHTSRIRCVMWSADQGHILSGSADRTVRVWDTDSGRCLRVLKGHDAEVLTISWSADGRRAFSGDETGGIRIWDLSEFVAEAKTPKATAKPSASVQDQAQYTNAKVLLVGNSAAGKTGLANRMASNTFEKTDSTVGAWATQLKLPVEKEDGIEREVWLWDFGGQADQRLIHQLYMDQTHLAALVFDPQKEDVFDTLSTWDRDMTRAATQDFKKLLVAGRTDAGGLRSVSKAQAERFAKDHGFARYLETSAKEGVGCKELKQAIVDLIDWDQIAERTSPLLFKRLKEEIVKLKDEGRSLMRFNELREALALRMSGERFSDPELKTVVSLLAGPGVVWTLGFGSWILLQPELINAHAQAVIQALRQDEREIGCIAEERVLGGDLVFPKSQTRLPEDEERIVLLAMHQVLVERGLCLRDEGPDGKSPTMLVFPSYARKERPDLIEHPSVIVSYQFNGFLDEIYATLVVRLHHTQPFERDQLWRDAADFKTMTGRRLGVKLTRRADGAGELEVYFDPEIPVEDMMAFSKYVHEHLLKKAKGVERLRHYVCRHCATPVKNREVAMRKLNEKGKKASIICVDCEKRVKLWDELEELFIGPEIQARVRVLEEQTKTTLDNESKERILVGEVISTVGLAGQLSRELIVSDHGIDMEVEFKNDDGEATGKKLYLQLKSGDSYLTTRKHDGAELFKIKSKRHADYWREQAFPVFLVVRNSKGEVRWMEIRDYLKRESDNGKKAVRQIVFDGERFDVMGVRRWRDKALGGGLS